jgi:hypothetical protein
MFDLGSTCILFLGSQAKIGIDDRRTIAGYISEFGFTASDIPSSKSKPILLWRSNSPIDTILSRVFPSVYDTRPELVRARPARRPRG